MIFERECYALAGLVTALGLVYVFRRESFGKHWSISLHASAHRSTVRAFGVALLAAAALLAVYFGRWLVPKYEYPWSLQVVLWLTVVCLALLALVPHYEGKWQGKVHVYVTWLMVVLMPITLVLVGVHSWGQPAGIVALCAVLTQLALLAVFYGVKGMHEKFVVLQSLFIATYFVCIGALGYL